MPSVEVKKRKGESFEALMRRFTRRVSASGKILESRKIRYYSSEPNKNKVRESALRRKTIRENREWLIKTGRLIENQFGRNRSRGRS